MQNNKFPQFKFLIISVFILIFLIYYFNYFNKQSISNHCNVLKDKSMNQLLEKTPWTNLKVPHAQSTVRVYHFGKDDLVSKMLMNGSGWWLWHPEITSALASFLKKETTLHLIDVGANLGYFTLLAAKIFEETDKSPRRHVVAVEGNKETAERIYLSLLYNKFDEFVTVVQNVVTNERGPASFVNHFNNRDIMHVLGDADFASKKGPLLKINGIYLDDLLEVITFKRAVLKIDIEGSEYRAFTHAAKLFDKIDIPVVLMESAFIDQFSAHPHLIKFFTDRNYSLFTNLESKEPNLDVNNPKSWPRDIVWKTKPFLY